VLFSFLARGRVGKDSVQSTTDKVVLGEALEEIVVRGKIQATRTPGLRRERIADILEGAEAQVVVENSPSSGGSRLSDNQGQRKARDDGAKNGPMIELHLYGDLRRHAGEETTSRQSVVQLVIGHDETVGSVLRKAGINPAEVGQVFLDHKLLDSRCSMRLWLGYQSARERIPSGGSYLDAPVRSGDRLGLFPTNMAMLVI